MPKLISIKYRKYWISKMPMKQLWAKVRHRNTRNLSVRKYKLSQPLLICFWKWNSPMVLQRRPLQSTFIVSYFHCIYIVCTLNIHAHWIHIYNVYRGLILIKPNLARVNVISNMEYVQCTYFWFRLTNNALKLWQN